MVYKFGGRISWLSSWKRYDVCRENFRKLLWQDFETVFPLSSFAVLDISNFILDLWEWLRILPSTYPARLYVSLWLRLYSMRFAFRPFSFFFFFPRFYSRCAIQLSCRWPCLNLFQEFHGEHGFLHANATNFSLSLVLLFRCCVHACLDIVMFKRL